MIPTRLFQKYRCLCTCFFFLLCLLESPISTTLSPAFSPFFRFWLAVCMSLIMVIPPLPNIRAIVRVPPHIPTITYRFATKIVKFIFNRTAICTRHSRILGEKTITTLYRVSQKSFRERIPWFTFEAASMRWTLIREWEWNTHTSQHHSCSLASQWAKAHQNTKGVSATTDGSPSLTDDPHSRVSQFNHILLSEHGPRTSVDIHVCVTSVLFVNWVQP